MTPTWSDERRQAPRQPCNVRFSYFYRGQRREAMMSNVSRVGSFLDTSSFPPPGSIVLLESFHDAARGLIVRFVVQVVRSVDNLTAADRPGIGVAWRRAYCNRGAIALADFVRDQFGFELDAAGAAQEEPALAEREVFYDFQEEVFRLRTPNGEGGTRQFHHPTPRSFMLIRDLPPAELPRPAEGQGDAEIDVGAGPDTTGGSPSSAPDEVSWRAAKASGLTGSRPAAREGGFRSHRPAARSVDPSSRRTPFQDEPIWPAPRPRRPETSARDAAGRSGRAATTSSSEWPTVERPAVSVSGGGRPTGRSSAPHDTPSWPPRQRPSDTAEPSSQRPAPEGRPQAGAAPDERRTDERRTDERRTDERRTDERRTDERRMVERRMVERPSSARPPTEPSSGRRPATERAVAEPPPDVAGAASDWSSAPFRIDDVVSDPAPGGRSAPPEPSRGRAKAAPPPDPEATATATRSMEGIPIATKPPAAGSEPPPAVPTSGTASAEFEPSPSRPDIKAVSSVIKAAGEERAPAKIGVTYSVGNRHYTGFTSHVGERSLRIVTREAAPEKGTRIVVRLPIPRHVGYHIARLSCRIINVESDPLESGGPTAFDLQVQVIDDAGNPGGFRKFVRELIASKNG